MVLLETAKREITGNYWPSPPPPTRLTARACTLSPSCVRNATRSSSLQSSHRFPPMSIFPPGGASARTFGLVLPGLLSAVALPPPVRSVLRSSELRASLAADATVYFASLRRARAISEASAEAGSYLQRCSAATTSACERRVVGRLVPSLMEPM